MAVEAGLLTGLALSLSLYLWSRNMHLPDQSVPALAYVLENSVTHARFLPAESTHSFTYPTLSLLLSLDALEKGQLNIGKGILFGYAPRWAVMGVSPAPYLQESPNGSIQTKLASFLKERLPTSHTEDMLGGVWMMTMPSYMGFAGINPLTVYFCYGKDEQLSIVVLEVHNTFGERHVYLLQVGKGEDVDKPQGYTHQWTFARQFHVSPFNTRDGFYRCSIVPPPHPPNSASQHSSLPRPIVRLHLLTSTSPPQKKLSAILRATTTTPLTPSSLLLNLSRYPFALFLTFPRIAGQAFVLHYKKKLNVFARPEPIAAEQRLERDLGEPHNPVEPPASDEPLSSGKTGAIGWQPEGWMERWARERFETFLEHRTTEGNCAIQVRLISSQGHVQVFPEASSTTNGQSTLDIIYRSPRFFTILLLAPSAHHTLLLGCKAERLFSTSNDQDFLSLLDISSSSSCVNSNSILSRTARSIRKSSVSTPDGTVRYPQYINDTQPHPLDVYEPPSWMLVFILSSLYALERVEKKIYTMAHARFVEGDEPWGGWERLERLEREENIVISREKRWQGVGSVRRD